jgi:hypothetical protein
MRSGWLAPARLALAFTLGQVAFALALAPASGDLKGRYLRLIQWDAFHYLDIVERGYRIPVGMVSREDVHEGRANAGFFPGFPLAAKAVGAVSGLRPDVAALLVAQLAAFAFWFYLLAFLADAGVAAGPALRSALLVALQPACFFLVAGYSESLFCAAMMGLVYWTERWVRRGGVGPAALLVVHGVVLSSARLVGIPLAVYPLARALLARQRGPRLAGALAMSAAASLGGLAFFAYCQWKFGEWNLYLRLQHLGWGNEPDFLALFKPWLWVPRLFFEDTNLSATRASVAFTFAVFVWVLARDLLTSRKWRARAALYGIAFAQFFVALSGKASYQLDSMIRYVFPVFALTVVAGAWAVAADSVVLWPRGTWTRRLAWGACALAGATEVWMLFRYLRGGWVA